MSNKPYRKSKSSGVVAIRLPNSVLFTIKRRINGRRSRWASIGQYLKERIIYDVERLHGNRKKGWDS
jgi:hypothetical protein